MSGGIVTVTLNPAIDVSLGIADFQVGGLNRVAWERSEPGGKGVNVAAFLAELGVPATVTGLLGADNAAQFEAMFAAKSITDRFVRIPGRVRSNIKIIERPGKPVTEVNFPGPAADAAALQALWGLLVCLAGDNEWFVLAGSAPGGVPVEFLAELVAMLKSHGRRVLLDASAEHLRLGLAAGPHWAKPNLVELEAALGRRLANEAEICAGARELIEAGVGGVVVSLGPRGALFLNAEQALMAQAPALEPLTTVGAGDAMVAGLMLGLLRDEPLDELARLASATAAAVLLRRGPGLADGALVGALRQQIGIRPARR